MSLAPRFQGATILLGLAFGIGLAACDDPKPPRAGVEAATQDTTATVQEVRAALAGAAAAGGQAYSYRGLYAGLTKSQLQRVLAAGRADSVSCHPEPKPVGEQTCAYHATLGPDSARVDIDVAYAPGVDSARVAHTITVTRALPLDVDGVAVASRLATEFEKQTAFLDRREASYGEHQAQVRMGSVNASHLNYVDVTVSRVHGREVMVVKMSRNAPARVAPAATTPAKVSKR